MTYSMQSYPNNPFRKALRDQPDFIGPLEQAENISDAQMSETRGFKSDLSNRGSVLASAYSDMIKEARLNWGGFVKHTSGDALLSKFS
mgnify:CR=1 FL=1